MTWRATILTLFPGVFPGPLGVSLAGRALQKKIWECRVVDLRDYGVGKHRNVDDTPFGGGSGMVIRADVLQAAYEDNFGDSSEPLVYFTPRGRRLSQRDIEAFTRRDNVPILCGHFEGVDERFLKKYPVEEISIGDYVLSGGEMAALVFLDACVRLLPGVMGNPGSKIEESFSRSLLEYPQYTRPSQWEGMKVPDVLLSGNHKAIKEWRLHQAQSLTQERRPDLWHTWLAKQGS